MDYKDDPTATYRGYRRQALYALYRLFDDGLPSDIQLQPEGYEDLAVFSMDGKLLEMVQVKDHTSNLAASSFKSIFYKRIANHCQPGSATAVTIASFGPIGPDLQNAKNGDAVIKQRVIKTIIGRGIKKQIASDIIDHIRLQEVSEDVLTDKIVDVLSKTNVGIDARQAFNFLMWWMLTSSETQQMIDRQMAIQKLNSIGKFLASRAAYSDEWYQTIIPVHDRGVPANLTKLTDEFYCGGRVQFDHIAAGLDVSRGRFLTQIHESFSKSNIVITHSASGQGKTTLAYRYMKEFAPSEFRFEALQSNDLKHARRMALALTAYSSAVEIPTLVFVDVRPGDLNWIELVRGLSSAEGIHILVAIREEDWRLSNVRSNDFMFQEIELQFDENEAREIYDIISNLVPTRRHVDFEDAWAQFGERKTLIEFVYFITQEESLSDRVKGQVTKLLDDANSGVRLADEIEMLRVVAVASAFEAKLDLNGLISMFDIPSPKRTVDLFEEEYFIHVTEGNYVEGFHAIRSEILCEELVDMSIRPWTEVAKLCLPILVEDDLERFLLCSFSRYPDTKHQILAALDSFQPKTWSGLCGIFRALCWYGLSEYIDENWELINQAYQEFASAWQIMLDWDLAQVTGQEGLQLFDSLGGIWEKAAERSRYFKVHQSDKQKVFDTARQWFSNRNAPPNPPLIIADQMAMSEIMFWIGHLDIDTIVRDWFVKNEFTKIVKELPIYHVGDFVRGVRESHKVWYEEWFADHLSVLQQRLYSDASIVKLHEDDESVIGHFIIDLDQNASILRHNKYGDAVTKTTVHDITIERVELLGNIFPGKQRYGAVGYGHKMSFMPSEFDEADKPGVLAKNLHPTWTPRFNALARGLVDQRFRPVTWNDFFTHIQDIRQMVLDCFSDLYNTLVTVSRNPLQEKAILNKPDAWDICKKTLRNGVLFPKSAVDEWGFITESHDKKNGQEILDFRYTTVSRLEGFRKAVGEYCRTVENFMNQAIHGLVLLPPLRNAEGLLEKQHVRDVAKQNGISEKSIGLSIINACDACEAVRMLAIELSQLPKTITNVKPSCDFNVDEYLAFLRTFNEWYDFVNPSKRTPKKTKKGVNSRKNKRKNKPLAKSLPLYNKLIPVRNNIKSKLISLNKKGIRARILNESVQWEDSLSLWVSLSVRHPCSLPEAFELLWEKLHSAFEPYRSKSYQISVIRFLWSKIIVVPLVNGKSLEQQACPNFNGVIYQEKLSLDQAWRFLPYKIPDETFEQLQVECWDTPHHIILFDEFISNYVNLLRHTDHVADFFRMPDELDDPGIKTLQTYINRETEGLNPLLQATFDSCVKVLDIINGISESELMERPNMQACLKIISELGDVITPTVDFDQEATLSLNQITEWRARLLEGFGHVGEIRYYWLADCLGFSGF